MGLYIIKPTDALVFIKWEKLYIKYVSLTAEKGSVSVEEQQKNSLKQEFAKYQWQIQKQNHIFTADHFVQ